MEISNRDNQWALHVGRFVLAFGDIEHTTILLLSLIPACNIPNTAPKLALGIRLDMLREVLSVEDDGEYREVLEAVERVKKMVTNRNLIAHNAIRFDVYQEGNKILFDTNIVSARDRRKKLSLSQLQKLADEAEGLSAGLTNASIPLMHRYGTIGDGGS